MVPRTAFNHLDLYISKGIRRPCSGHFNFSAASLSSAVSSRGSGMGEVYRARDAALKREVAIKVLPEYWSRDPERLHRFEQEAQAAAALNHPNIVSIFHVGQYNGSPYIVTELLHGETLRERLRQRRRREFQFLLSANATYTLHSSLRLPAVRLWGHWGEATSREFSLDPTHKMG